MPEIDWREVRIRVVKDHRSRRVIQFMVGTTCIDLEVPWDHLDSHSDGIRLGDLEGRYLKPIAWHLGQALEQQALAPQTGAGA